MAYSICTCHCHDVNNIETGPCKRKRHPFVKGSFSSICCALCDQKYIEDGIVDLDRYERAKAAAEVRIREVMQQFANVMNVPPQKMKED